VGLFSKKPKSIIVPRPDEMAAPAVDPMDRLEQTLPIVTDLPQLAPPPPKATPAKPPKPPKQMKQARKVGVDPADFLALRAELIDMRARLDESEQARALVEARLSSLDAATAAFSTERGDIDEIVDVVTQLQKQVAENTNNPVVTSAPSTAGNDELSAKVDALQNRMFGMQDYSPKIAEFEAQIAELRSELESATTAAADAAALPPPPPAATGPDPETLERIAAVQMRVNELDQIRHRLGEIDFFKERMAEIDQLHQRVSDVESSNQNIGDMNVDQRLATIDGLAMQLQQLNARVAAQAELGGQLSTLRDRVNQMAEQPKNGGVDDDIRLQLQEIGERLRSQDELRAQVGQLAERATATDTEARAVRDHMALLDQRLTNVSTELANQIGELGRDIDGLGQRVPEVADGVVSDEVVDALRGSQVKLANEQARYEIAFRQDLASLAEQLRQARDDEG
jgi:tetrahydromethanopterin S-methyltransferase subunit G